MLTRRTPAPRATRRTAPSILVLTPILVIALALAACARSPQTVMLAPSLTGPPGQIASPRTVDLVVTDNRDSLVVGSRGGIYSETANITTEEDVRPGLRSALSRALEKQGYSVVAPGSSADMKLAVDLQKLTYTTGGSGMLTEIKLSAAVGAACTKGGETISSRYETSQTRKMATAPDAAENSNMINQVLAKSIDEMLTDRELRDFMAK